MENTSQTAVIQVYWTENAKCFDQNEPQAVHFGQKVISIMSLELVKGKQ